MTRLLADDQPRQAQAVGRQFDPRRVLRREAQQVGRCRSRPGKLPSGAWAGTGSGPGWAGSARTPSAAAGSTGPCPTAGSTPWRDRRDSVCATAVNGIPSKSASRQTRSPPASIRCLTVLATLPRVAALLFMVLIVALSPKAPHQSSFIAVKLDITDATMCINHYNPCGCGNNLTPCQSGRAAAAQLLAAGLFEKAFHCGLHDPTRTRVHRARSASLQDFTASMPPTGGVHCHPPAPRLAVFSVAGKCSNYRHHSSREVVRASSWRLSVSVTVSLSRKCPLSLRPQRRTNELQTPHTSEDAGDFREGRTGSREPGRRGRFRGVCKCLRTHGPCGIGPSMAFIVLRRSRNTQSYYLVESYRDRQGKTRRRTVCYLGRQQDDTDTLAKALAHWQQVMGRAKRELRKARGDLLAEFRAAAPGPDGRERDGREARVLDPGETPSPGPRGHSSRLPMHEGCLRPGACRLAARRRLAASAGLVQSSQA